MSKLHFPISFN